MFPVGIANKLAEQIIFVNQFWKTNIFWPYCQTLCSWSTHGKQVFCYVWFCYNKKKNTLANVYVHYQSVNFNRDKKIVYIGILYFLFDVASNTFMLLASLPGIWLLLFQLSLKHDYHMIWVNRHAYHKPPLLEQYGRSQVLSSQKVSIQSCKPFVVCSSDHFLRGFQFSCCL